MPMHWRRRHRVGPAATRWCRGGGSTTSQPEGAIRRHEDTHRPVTTSRQASPRPCPPAQRGPSAAQDKFALRPGNPPLQGVHAALTELRMPFKVGPRNRLRQQYAVSADEQPNPGRRSRSSSACDVFPARQHRRRGQRIRRIDVTAVHRTVRHARSGDGHGPVRNKRAGERLHSKADMSAMERLQLLHVQLQPPGVPSVTSVATIPARWGRLSRNGAGSMAMCGWTRYSPTSPPADRLPGVRAPSSGRR